MSIAPHPPRSGPPSPRGEGINAAKIEARLRMSSATLPKSCERSVASTPVRVRRRGEAHRRQGWVGGVYPSAQFMARTAAFDGHTAFTRAARSAGLRFAVRSLSKAMDRGTTKSGACVGTSSTADAVPLPLRGEGLIALEIGARLAMSTAAIAYCLLPIAFQQSSAPGPWSLVPCP